MGMYDSVVCNAPLPTVEGAPTPSNDFQTKDFHRALDLYTITAEGKLLFDSGWPGTDGEACPPKEITFHGILNFYTFEGDNWFEYNAKFTDGRLIEITPVEIYSYIREGEPPKGSDVYDHRPVVATQFYYPEKKLVTREDETP